ncbi:MAG: RagB/SusD family nutrient uptake outer membrane protein [Bacteroidales bacterium]
MRKIFYSIVAGLTIIMVSACDYLEIVPDNILEITSMFENKEKATAALATCYSFIPKFEKIHESPVLMGSEYMARPDLDPKKNLRGFSMMLDLNNSTSPIMGYWGGNNGARNLYEGIRLCNTFLENVHLVPNFEEGEADDYVAQVKFLKAYFHFLLVNYYGPVVLVRENFDHNASTEQIRQYQAPIDECFSFIVSLLDEAIPNLPASRLATTLGQVDRTAAYALKAKVLLYQASPLFNGNTEFYSGFKSPRDGKALFNQSYDPEKWGKAASALKEAIDFAHQQRKRLYTYKSLIKDYDRDLYDRSGIMRYAYDARYSVLDAWNEELIWGRTGTHNSLNDQGTIQHGANMRMEDANERNESSFTWQWLGATYAMTELFYTRNGVPIKEDKTFDYENRMKIVNVPNDDYYVGYMQQGNAQKTIQLHLDREPRFYAWIGVDRCLWRTHDVLNNVNMREGEYPGGKISSKGFDFYCTGIAIKKVVHPESRNRYWQRVIKYPWPMIRLSDLYLMYAEALNEYQGPGAEVFHYLDLIREKRGLPQIEQVWSNPDIVSDVNRHLDKSGLRKIIHTERLIELCFEGHQFNDIRRWKRAGEFYNAQVEGWDVTSTGVSMFYQKKPVYSNGFMRKWQTPRDYFMPIPYDELNKNPNLIQNVGW